VLHRLLSVLAVASFVAPVAAEERSRWLTDYEQARKAARASGKPILVVFRCEH
jgi:hypothetical protein